MSKIAVIIPSSFDNSGVPKVCIALFQALKVHHEFIFLVRDNENNYYKDYVLSEGAKVFYLGESKNKYFRYAYRLCNRNRIIQQIFRDEKVDIMYTCSGYEAGFECLIASKLGIKKRIVHSHGIFIDRIGKNYIIRVYQKVGRKLLEKYSTDRLAVSYEAGESLFPKQQYTVINNPIEIEKYAGVIPKAHEDTQLIQIGYFNANKNQLFSLKLLNELVKKKVSVKLTFIGYPIDDAYYQSMIEYIRTNNLEKHIVFLPHDVKKEDVLSVMDYALIPSIHEGLSLVALECQLASIKLITSTGVPDCVNLGMMKKYELSEMEKWIDCILDDNKSAWKLDTNKLSRYSYETFKTKMQSVFDGDMDGREYFK